MIEIVIIFLFILFCISVFAIVLFQHKMFDYMRDFYNDFLDNLTDGKNKVKKRGDPVKGLIFLFSHELSNDKNVEFNKKVIRFFLLLIFVLLLAFFSFMLYLGGRPLY